VTAAKEVKKDGEIYGVIDMGSNTFRLSLYRYEADQLTLLLGKKFVVGLADYIERDELSDRGIVKACSALEHFLRILDNFNISNYFVFATASLRNVQNRGEVLDMIRKRTGLKVDVLSGEREATLDFIGASRGVCTDKGVLVDIGGGSTELTLYENGEILQAASMPVGSLNLYSKYVKKLLPNVEERRKIRKKVAEELKTLENSGKICPKKFVTLCGVGGSVRAAAALNNEIFEGKSGSREMEADDVEKVLHVFSSCNKDTLRWILQVAPERIHTAIPGMIILQTVSNYFKCERILVSRLGIREGYLYEKICRY